MKESQIAVMEEFVDNVKVLINALGYKVLNPLLRVGDDNSVAEEALFSQKTLLLQDWSRQRALLRLRVPL